MFQAYLATFPWDVADDRLHAFLDPLQGELGLSGVAAWVASAPLIQCRASADAPSMVYSSGGLLFEYQSCRYSELPIQPAGARDVHVPDRWLSRLREACGRRGLHVRGVLSASRMGGLVERAPSAATQNLYGIASRQAVCPLNPAVQECLRTIVAELSDRFALESLLITDLFCGWVEAYSPLLEPARLDRSIARAFLARCFCPACCRGAAEANVDVEAARSAARDTLADLVGESRDGAAGQGISNAIGVPLAEFDTWRGAAYRALLQRLSNEAGGRVLVDIRDWTLSISPQAITPADGRVGLAFPLVEAGTKPASDRSESPPNEVLVEDNWLTLDRVEPLVRALAEAAERGAIGATFHAIGPLTTSATTAIRRAVRFARRVNTA